MLSARLRVPAWAAAPHDSPGDGGDGLLEDDLVDLERVAVAVVVQDHRVVVEASRAAASCQSVVSPQRAESGSASGPIPRRTPRLPARARARRRRRASPAGWSAGPVRADQQRRAREQRRLLCERQVRRLQRLQLEAVLGECVERHLAQRRRADDRPPPQRGEAARRPRVARCGSTSARSRMTASAPSARRRGGGRRRR